MSLVSSSWHWLQNTDGTFDGHYPAGDKPITGPNLIWATSGYAVLNTLVVNHAFTEDQVPFLSGPNAGIATLSIEQVSGDNYATENWTIPAGVLTHPSNSDQGAGVFRIKATDGTLSVYQPNRSWAYLPPPELQMKWNPGIYILMVGQEVPADSTLDEIAAITQVKGIQVHSLWYNFETAKNVYNFTFIDAVMAKCRARGLRLIINLLNFTSGSSLTNKWPSYLTTEDGGASCLTVQSTDVRLKYHSAAAMTRWIALQAAIGAHLDSDPLYEGMTFEDSISGTPQPAASALATQFNRWIDASATNFPTSNVWIALDSGFNDLSYFPPLVARMAAKRCGISGSDAVRVTNDWSSNGFRAYRGLVWNGSAWVAGGVDQRPHVPCCILVSGYSLSQEKSLDTILSYLVTTNNQQHIPFLYKTWTVGGNKVFQDIYWDNTKSYAVDIWAGSPDEKTWLQTTRDTVTTPPSTYAAVITGGT